MTVSLVTGANRGIGREVARQRAARGDPVLLGAR
ncbi:MAG: dehydrogenase, partial [Bacteroidota bacterium]